MPQVQLPVFPADATAINDALACRSRDGQTVYLNGHLSVFTRVADDLASFRFFTTQLIVKGSATQGEIARAFGVPRGTVKRCVKRHRTRGAPAFFMPAPRREGSRLTAAVRAVAQGLLAQGLTVPEIGRQTGVVASTLHKALRAGRLTASAKKSRRGRPRRQRACRRPRPRHHAECAQRDRSAGAARFRHHPHARTRRGQRGPARGRAAALRARRRRAARRRAPPVAGLAGAGPVAAHTRALRVARRILSAGNDFPHPRAARPRALPLARTGPRHRARRAGPPPRPGPDPGGQDPA